ncbi:hypothetical protein V2J09_005242 [Rumex salicifolius]
MGPGGAGAGMAGAAPPSWLVGGVSISISKHSKSKLLLVSSSGGQGVESPVVGLEDPPRRRRVVVTGLGLVTPLGDQPDTFYNNLLEGVSGVSHIQSFDCSHFPTRIGGEVKSFSPQGWVSPRLFNKAEKNIVFTIASGKKALHHAGLLAPDDDDSAINKARCGVIIGSAIGGLKIKCDAVQASAISPRRINPFSVPFSLTHMGSALLATELGWMGPNYSISTACTTSNSCILSAADHISRGDADMMLCGGSDSVVTPLGLAGFVACNVLSRRNDDPTKASRPWDKKRDGFVMGEGAGVLLLEELEHAQQRGAHIYAEFLGGCSTNDAYHMMRPHPTGEGLVLCIERALGQCGVAKEDINYINAHASSTVVGDSLELKALHQVFGLDPEVRINSTKSMTGNLIGASGAVEAIAVAIETGWIHPNLNLEDPDEELSWRVLVKDKKERLDVKVALSISFGFGGHNSCILLSPFK